MMEPTCPHCGGEMWVRHLPSGLDVDAVCRSCSFEAPTFDIDDVMDAGVNALMRQMEEDE